MMMMFRGRLRMSGQSVQSWSPVARSSSSSMRPLLLTATDSLSTSSASEEDNRRIFRSRCLSPYGALVAAAVLASTGPDTADSAPGPRQKTADINSFFQPVPEVERLKQASASLARISQANDMDDPLHEHQRVVIQWNVYAVHREKRGAPH